MSTESYIRSEPCTNCGEPLVVIELYSEGWLLDRLPTQAVRRVG